MSEDLYDRDFYLWTRQQGAALRDRRFGDNVLELDRIAEEIEDLGDARYNKAESFAQRIVEHFYKLSAGGNPQPHRHWLVEIVNFRAGLERVLTPTVRNELERAMERVHARGYKAARQSMQLFEPHVELDPERRWTLEEVEGTAQPDPFEAFRVALAPHEDVRTERPR